MTVIGQTLSIVAPGGAPPAAPPGVAPTLPIFDDLLTPLATPDRQKPSGGGKPLPAELSAEEEAISGVPLAVPCPLPAVHAIETPAIEIAGPTPATVEVTPTTPTISTSSVAPSTPREVQPTLPATRTDTQVMAATSPDAANKDAAPRTTRAAAPSPTLTTADTSSTIAKPVRPRPVPADPRPSDPAPVVAAQRAHVRSRAPAVEASEIATAAPAPNSSSGELPAGVQAALVSHVATARTASVMPVVPQAEAALLPPSFVTTLPASWVRTTQPLDPRRPTAPIPATLVAQGAAPLPGRGAMEPLSSPPALQPAVGLVPDSSTTSIEQPKKAEPAPALRSSSSAPAVAPPASPVVAAVPPPAPPASLPAAQVFAAAIHRALGERETQGTEGASAIGLALAAAATAIRTDGTPALDMQRETWPAKMIERIEQLRDTADANDTSIRLAPDALGTIDVSLKRDGDQVRVHFAAAQAETRQLLADAQPRLTELAEARGLRLSHGAPDSGAGQQQPQRQPSAATVPARVAASDAADTTDTDQRIA